MRTLLLLSMLAGCGHASVAPAAAVPEPQDVCGLYFRRHPVIPPATIRRISGLYTSPNPYGSVPEGALSIADDVLVRAPGVLESRRGLAPSANTFAADRCFPLPGTTKAITTARSSSNPSLYDPDADTVTTLSRAGGTQPLAYPYQSDVRTSLWGAAANSVLYLGGQQGLAAVSGSSWRAGGLPKPVWDEATHVVKLAGAAYAPFNFTSVARRLYRVTLAWYDPQGNFHESEPSFPVPFDNLLGVAETAVLGVRYPPGTPVGAFFRLWRAVEVPIGGTSDEMFLIREYVDSAQVAGTDGYVSTATPVAIVDISVDSLLNVPLYTNPQTGDGFGILSGNAPPPAASVIAWFKQRMYYGRPTYQQQLEVQIIGTSAAASSNGIVDGDVITIDGSSFTATNDGGGFSYGQLNNCFVSATQFRNSTSSSSVALNIEATSRSLVSAINAAANNRYLAGYAPQRLTLAYYASSGIGGDIGRIVLYRPTQAPLADDPGIAISVVSTTGGLRFPGGSKTSTDSYDAGGLAWSKPNQPEAVPAINFGAVGDPAKAILGFAVLRDSMVIFKEDGAFILYDQGGPQPTIQVLDPSINAVGPQTIGVLNNAIYLLSEKGPVMVTEQTTTEVGEPIREELQDLLARNLTGGALAFGCAYESERLYILGVPISASENGCSLQYVYNAKNGAWQRWTKAGAQSAMVLPDQDKLLMPYAAALPPGNVVTGLPAQGVYLEKKGGVVSTDYVDLIGGLPAATYAALSVSTPRPGTPPAVRALSTLTFAQDMHLQVFEGDLIYFKYADPDGKTRDQLVRVTSVVASTVYTDSVSRVSTDGTRLMTLAPTTYYRAIQCHWRFAQQAMGEPTLEKQWHTTQHQFDYIDADWVDILLDTEKSGPRLASQIALDPQIVNTSAALSAVQWLRPCRNIVLRVDPAQAESRSATLGMEYRFNQARSRFRLVAASAHAGEFKEASTR